MLRNLKIRKKLAEFMVYFEKGQKVHTIDMNPLAAVNTKFTDQKI